MLAFLGVVGLGGGISPASRSTPKPAPCTCVEQQYCKPLSTPAPEFEIYPFVIPTSCGNSYCGNLTKYWFDTFRWDLITTASWTIGANETICHAHKMGARVAVAAGLGPGAGCKSHKQFCALFSAHVRVDLGPIYFQFCVKIRSISGGF